MPSLFDHLGPAFRAPDVSAALESLAADSEVERGAVFTPQVPHFARANQSISGLGRSPNQ
jgi:hypothetical protein